MARAKPGSLNLSDHQRSVLRHIIRWPKYAKVSRLKRRWPDYERTLKIMLERNLILIVNEEDIHITPHGKRAWDKSESDRQRFRNPYND